MANLHPVPAAAPEERPRHRGLLHQWAAPVALGAGVGLVAIAPSARARVGVAVYALSLVVLFGVSALYHRRAWTPRVRMWLRRADHAAIFLLIGGTYTPVALLGVGGPAGSHLLAAVWVGVAIGVLVALFWTRAPKAVSAALAVAVGWTAAPYLGDVHRAVATPTLWLILAGGVAYTVGALVYAVRRPDPWPRVFGYHEVFHACTLVGATLHLAVVVAILR